MSCNRDGHADNRMSAIPNCIGHDPTIELGLNEIGLPASARLAGTLGKVEAAAAGSLRWGPMVALVATGNGVGPAASRSAELAPLRTAAGRRPANRDSPCRHPAGEAPSGCPELDCVRHLLPAPGHRRRGTPRAVDRRRRRAGADLRRRYDRGSLPHGAGAFARHLLEQFDALTRADCPLSDDQLIDAGRGRSAAAAPAGRRGLVWIVAPRGLTARRLADPQQPGRTWLHTVPPDLARSATAVRRRSMPNAPRAACGRQSSPSRPLLSNAPREHGWQARCRRLAVVTVALLFSLAAPLLMIES